MRTESHLSTRLLAMFAFVSFVGLNKLCAVQARVRSCCCVAGTASLMLLVAGLLCSTVSADQPNIVLVLCDDLGYADVGFNGAKDIITPHLDELAANGTIFTSAYVTHPFCGPSRMGLMSGRYPHEFGAPFNLPQSGLGIEKYNKLGIDENEVLISTVLQKAGYFTGAVGKWHMGYEPPFHPNNRGFDDYYGFLGGGHKYFPEQFQPVYERQRARGVKNIHDYVQPLEHNGKQVEESEYVTDGLSREACRFVKQASAKQQPFFLYLAYNAPHSPLEAKDDDMAKFAGIVDEKRRTYAAMVYAVDRGIGKLVQTLKSTGEFESTLIVFLSDNGGKLGLGANNGPLREGKGSTHEGGFRVPMFFHWPGKVPNGKRFQYPVTALDFYPTFARLAGATIPDGKQVDGKDIWDDLLADQNPRSGEMIYAVRHRSGFSDVGIRSDQWKAVKIYNGRWKLFDVDRDISESRDLSSQHPGQLQQMVQAAEKWGRTHTQPLWFDNLKAEATWKKDNMPRYEKTFAVD